MSGYYDPTDTQQSQQYSCYQPTQPQLYCDALASRQSHIPYSNGVSNWSSYYPCPAQSQITNTNTINSMAPPALPATRRRINGTSLPQLTYPTIPFQGPRESKTDWETKALVNAVSFNSKFIRLATRHPEQITDQHITSMAFENCQVELSGAALRDPLVRVWANHWTEQKSQLTQRGYLRDTCPSVF